MRSRRVISSLLFISLVAAACSSNGDASGVTGDAGTPATPAPSATAAEATETDGPPSSEPPPTPAPLDTVPCDDGAPASVPGSEVTCFVLTVRADRSTNEARTMTLPGLVLASKQQPALGALVIPGGGPGFTETTSAGFWAEHALRSFYDIVLYDQRGTGGAEPNLECTDRDDEVIASFQSAEEYPHDRFAVAEAALVCRARLAAGGIDFDDFDTAASAADLDELRAALGYDQWTIVGISYGSRLALESMRSFPDGLRSVILDSVYDVTAGGLTASVASGGRAIAELVADHPGLDASIDAVRARYNASPWEGEVDLGRGDGPRGFVVTGDDMMGGLFTALYDRTLIPLLPDVIRALEAGDTSVVPELLIDGLDFITAAADAMQLSVDCADNAGLDTAAADDATAEAPGWLGTLAVTAGPSCLDWEVDPTSPGFNEPVVSDIPALVLAGRFDPITPPAGSEAVARRLPNAQFVLFPTFGHGATGSDLCTTSIELKFLAEPTAPVDTSCIGGPAS